MTNSDLPIMSMETYELPVSDAASELLVLLAQGHTIAKEKRTHPASDVIANLRERLMT